MRQMDWNKQTERDTENLYQKIVTDSLTGKGAS